MGKRRFQTRDLILVGLFSALMIVGANLRIPFPIVPVTFQPFFAILAGLLLGPSLGFLSQVVYLFIGLAGFPVFADGSGGLAYILRPSFGFLIGFALSAWLAGSMMGKVKQPSIVWVMICAMSGLMILYAMGIGYMYAIQNLYLKNTVTLFALLNGMALFFVKDAILFLGASTLAHRLIPLLKRNDPS